MHLTLLVIKMAIKRKHLVNPIADVFGYSHRYDAVENNLGLQITALVLTGGQYQTIFF